MLVTTFYVFVMTICSLHYVNSATTKRSPDNDAVKFPGPMQEVNYGQTSSDVPPECQGKTYCTVKPTDYPQEKFNNMFKGTKSRASFQPSLEVEVVNRQGDPDEKDDCESVVTYEPLYKVVPKGEAKGKWRMVIQVPGENFVQRVRLETCVSQGARCFTVFPMAAEFETFCKQKYSTWEVLVSDGKNGTEKIKTDLPICCSCHYKALDFVNRFGKPKEEPKMTMKKH